MTESFSYITFLSYHVNDVIQLRDYLITNESLVSITGVLFDSDINRLTIFADTPFTQEMQNTIESMCSSYTNPIIPGIQKYRSINIYENKVSSMTFKTIGVYNYIKTEFSLFHLNIDSYLMPNTPNDSSVSDFAYTRRVVDVTNNIILGSNIFTNSNNTINIIDLNLTSDYNLHNLEVQVKKNSSSGAYIHINNCSAIEEMI